MDYSGLSERYAHAYTKTQAGDKPACSAFGWVVRNGVFTPGLLFVNEPVRARKLTFELYEPGDDKKPVKSALKLGEVTVQLGQHLQVCAPGLMYTDLELKITDARD